MIKLIALDFDGVIIDSAHDVFVTTQRLLEEKGEELEDSEETLFRKGRNFIRTGKGVYTLIEFLRQGKDFDKVTQEEFDNFMNEHINESVKLRDEFFAMRRKLQENNYEEWVSLSKVYPGIKEVLKGLSGYTIVVVSTKDSYSVSSLIDSFKIDVDKANIFSKEISENKNDIMIMIFDRFSVKPEEILFIDDMWKNLETTRKLGVNVALAGWGYNNDEQRGKTRQLGIPVLSKPEDIEKEIKRLDSQKN